jgi:hypothetical protein
MGRGGNIPQPKSSARRDADASFRSGRGEGIRNACRANDAPILNPICDTRELHRRSRKMPLMQGEKWVGDQKPTEEARAHLGFTLQNTEDVHSVECFVRRFCGGV